MAPERKRLVWDVPTRLFHWAVVALIGFAWWTAGNDHMDWHGTAGIVLLGLLVFRLLWGLFGASTARFGQFVKGPRAVWAYLRPGEAAEPAGQPGHNPLGSWSVVALLVLLAVQIVSGLFAVDVDGIESGPLSSFISFDTGRVAASVHHLGWDVLLVLVPIHVAAILFYLLVKRRNLTWTMIAGTEPGPGDGAVLAPRRHLLLALAVAAALAWWVSKGLSFR